MLRMGRRRGNRESEDLPGENKFNAFGEKSREHVSADLFPPACCPFLSTCLQQHATLPASFCFSIFFLFRLLRRNRDSYASG
jgi:hypothetical protein